MGQSRSVTWLPWRRRLPCRCWPARQAKPSTTPPSSSSSSTPSRRRRPWRRRRGGGRWRKQSHGFAPRSMPASLSLPPSIRPGTGPPLRPLGKKKKRKRRKLPKAPLPRCGRPCDLQRQVPAALRVLRVPRQNGGHSGSATETGTHSVLLGVLGQGRCAGVVQRQGYGQTVQKTVLAPQLQFIEGRRPPFVLQRQIPMVLPVQKTIETPQLQSVRWLMPLLCRSCHARCRSDRCSWFRHCRKLWRCRRCSSFAVVTFL